MNEPLTEQSLAGILVGSSLQMRSLRARILKLARSDIPVLIEGPTGCGKELVARALHTFSGRAGQFVAFNICAIGESMFEDALFGHARGAFTGAVDETPGYLLEADRGTAFLDEVSGLPLLLQAKLLRAVETREFRPVGAKRDRRSEFRLVAATNEELTALVRAGKFRDDLHYRLRAGVIHMPALHDRRGDIQELAIHFARSAATRDGGMEGVGLSAGALLMLEQYEWPGNVRELRNVVELALVLADEPLVGAREIAEALWDIAGTRHQPTEDSGFERRRLVDLLERCEWNTSLAAQELGVHRSHLYRLMQQSAITPRGRPRSAARLTGSSGFMDRDHEMTC